MLRQRKTANSEGRILNEGEGGNDDNKTFSEKQVKGLSQGQMDGLQCHEGFWVCLGGFSRDGAMVLLMLSVGCTTLFWLYRLLWWKAFFLTMLILLLLFPS
jgi:hypothetical protein